MLMTLLAGSLCDIASKQCTVYSCVCFEPWQSLKNVNIHSSRRINDAMQAGRIFLLHKVILLHSIYHGIHSVLLTLISHTATQTQMMKTGYAVAGYYDNRMPHSFGDIKGGRFMVPPSSDLSSELSQPYCIV